MEKRSLSKDKAYSDSFFADSDAFSFSDKLRDAAFSSAAVKGGAAVAVDVSERDGIGRLGERTLHSALKYYFEPDDSYHEARVGRYVADILHRFPEGSARAGEIIEIQTGSFGKLRDKINAFLADRYDITVVIPVIAKKKIYVYDRLDKDTGEMIGLTDGVASPKKENVYTAFLNLWELRPGLIKAAQSGYDISRISYCFVSLEIREYRHIVKGRRDIDKREFSGRFPRKGYIRSERIPEKITAEYWVHDKADIIALLPKNIGGEFTAADIAKELKLRPDRAAKMLSVMNTLGAVEKRRDGRAVFYKIAE